MRPAHPSPCPTCTDTARIERARASARRIARRVHDDMAGFTTTSVERATLRLMGVDGVDAHQVPLPNRVVDHLRARDLPPLGAAAVLAGAMIRHGLGAQAVAEAVAQRRDRAAAPRRRDRSPRARRRTRAGEAAGASAPAAPSASGTCGNSARGPPPGCT